MRVAIIHFGSSAIGGSERVGLSAIDALNEVGIRPDLITSSPIEAATLEKNYGKKISANVVPILPYDVKMFGIYQRALLSLLSNRFVDYDAILNTTGISMNPRSTIRAKKYLLYVHNPIIVRSDIEKYDSWFWGAYWKPYEWLVKMAVSRITSEKILSNSEFTKIRVQKYWKKDSEVVYPPVSIDAFMNNNSVRDGVISIGRFTPEKKHLTQLEVAKRLPQITFRLCGSAAIPYYKRWLDNLIAKAESMGLKNVEFYPNLSFKRIVEMTSLSKYFLHTMRDEDFGITTCEAIAGGCIPIVHNSGGQIEVVPFKELRFNNADEIVNIIQRLEKKTNERMSTELLKHIQKFGESEFKKKILNFMGIAHR